MLSQGNLIVQAIEFQEYKKELLSAANGSLWQQNVEALLRMISSRSLRAPFTGASHQTRREHGKRSWPMQAAKSPQRLPSRLHVDVDVDVGVVATGLPARRRRVMNRSDAPALLQPLCGAGPGMWRQAGLPPRVMVATGSVLSGENKREIKMTSFSS